VGVEFGSLKFRSTPVILGIISPPFSTKTVSPIRTSNWAITSALCNEALLTVVPANCTGFKFATGVTAPVRPTWYEIDSKIVATLWALYLYATAQRGLLTVLPKLLC